MTLFVARRIVIVPCWNFCLDIVRFSRARQVTWVQQGCLFTLIANVWHLELFTWLRHQMETFSALLAICAGNSPVTSGFPAQRPVTRSFEFFFELRPNKRLSKQSLGWWFETPTRSLWLWRHRNVLLNWCQYKCSTDIILKCMVSFILIINSSSDLISKWYRNWQLP